MKVHPGATISEKAMTMMNSLILHAFEKIAKEASKMAKCGKKSGGFLEYCTNRRHYWELFWLALDHQPIRNISKTTLSGDVTGDSSCCRIDADWWFGQPCNFRRLKIRHAIYYFKWKYQGFRIRRLFWRGRIWWLLHHWKLILTRQNTLTPPAPIIW